jgi:putative endonuclease
MYYLYILHSPSSDKYYIGHTDDPVRRLSRHNNSAFNTYTAKYRPWQIAALFQCGESRSYAIQIEKTVKKQKTKRFLEKLIQGEELFGEFAQLVRVPHVRD